MNQLPVQIDSLPVWLEQVDVALTGLADYLAQRTLGVPGPGSAEQLRYLQDYLETIKQSVLEGNLPSQRDRKVMSLGWVVSDGWNPSDPLGIRIELIDSYYLHGL